MFERIKRMVIKEFHQIFRDKRMRPIIFITPIIQLIVFGYAVTTDVNNVRMAVYDLDKSYESRELIRRFEASGYFQILRYINVPEEVRLLLDKGKVLAVLQVNHGFSADIKKGKQTEVQVLFDGTDSNTALVAMSYANTIITRYSRSLGATKIKAAQAKLDVRARAWYNPDLRSKNYNVPGVIAIMIMLICLLLTSMAIVREREIGTMEQLMVTPLRPLELILGKIIPFAIIGFFDMFLVTIVGVSWFSITIQGSLLLLVLCTG
ncbi:MAG: ABC transporter permease, partial [Proteobacteria bacterium]|nr:ABC transporter permease [Pseudomonadota bacterium]